MIIEPRTRGFICTTAHPDGCEQGVLNQIEYIKSKGKIESPKRVLVIGASTGFGLASRITSAFGSEASTIGVFFEKAPSEGRTASSGWYNTAAFEKLAHKEGLYAKSINGDAFSKEVKEQTIDLIKKDLGQIDMVVYSLASPVRTHPETGVRYKSSLKPIGSTYTNKTVDFHTGEVKEVSIAPAEGDDIENTVTVMGGEDWEMWIDALKKENLLSKDFKTVAYSYIGPKLTEPVYRNGTIGRAKDHLEATAFKITDKLKDIEGKAYISVNKALVTQSSSAIPVIPLYMSLLYQVMKDNNVHEGCIEQIHRLYTERLFLDEVPTDEEGRIRIDDLEMRDDIQEKVAELWEKVDTENVMSLSDLEGYRNEFFHLFGFNFEEVDYSKETEEVVKIAGLQ
ncbi:enoyl-ACP reductase FabV [Brumimicrobium oceani]|uniref:Enoyl-[acyl-carrier-protein] reductase [NADH] n=1 Tax=Brumimicrobium oceani TaxID=2100725 RepID=A0A2U2XFS5_9FLAO|nr:enoyl-ACP reductase FabV [Brumimicrobium oceani]PWH86613.1 bifunctional NADH-specific enoyl-ACP reductase/trans-2-enoyl-CoA reductase [Brumimicrobium oceani]